MPKTKKPRAAHESVSPQPVEQGSQVHEDSPWRKHAAIAAALFVITLAAYSNSFRSGFPLDNTPLLLQDPRIQSATSENVSLILNHSAWWVPPETGLYRPITTLTYLFNYAVIGDADHPAGYHYVNFMIHFMNVLLCYGLALSILKKISQAVFVAALWAVHPVLTEAVTNIVGRADLLAAFGVLSGVLMYRKIRESSGGRRIAWLVGLAAAATIAMFSKESGIAIAGLVALYAATWWKDRSQLRNLSHGMLAVAIPIIAYLTQRSYVLKRSNVPIFPFVDNPLIGAGFFAARLTALKVLAKYLWLLFWPAKLTWNYYYSEIPIVRGTPQDWMAWIVIAAAVAGVSIAYRRNRAVFFFAGFAFIALIPTSNLLILIGSIMAERFLYLPAIGFAACVVIGIYALGERLKTRALAPVVLCICIVALGIRTWTRNLDWFDNSTLVEAGVRDSPNSFASHFALATNLYLLDTNHTNMDRVIGEAEKSLTILDPLPNSQNFEDAYANAGTYYQVKGDLAGKVSPAGRSNLTSESVKAYQRALQILSRGAEIGKVYDQRTRAKEMARGKPASEVRHVGSKSLYPELAVTYFRIGENENAYDALRQALIIDPEQSRTFITLARVLLSDKREDEAAVAIVEAYMTSGNKEFLGPLAQLYSNGLDTKGCAISQNANGIALNTFCEPVHNHICRAKSELIRVYTQASRPDLIDDIKARTASDASCGDSTQK